MADAFAIRGFVLCLVATLGAACEADLLGELPGEGAVEGGVSGSGDEGRPGTDTQTGDDRSEGASGTSTQPPRVCDEPEPWPLPASRRTVGSGTATSCNADALRQAVAGGGFVTFACGDSPVSIRLSSAIRVTRPLVIDGAGAVTLDGGGTSQIFVVASNASLSARNLRFIRGKAPPRTEADGIGGAISGQWRSKIEVRDCTFEDNTAGRGGGAVSVWTGSALTVVGSRFLRNHSWYGGAIYSLLSPLQVVNSSFLDNVTLTDRGTGDGGAIGTDGASESPNDGVGGRIEICGSTFRNNEAHGLGGAAYLWAYPPDQVVIDRTTVEGNRVSKNGKGTSLGGGMRVSNGEIAIMASSFLANASEVSGGALYLDCSPSCQITNSTFYANRAGSYGGAIFGDKFRLANVTLAENHAGGHGGALFGGSDWVMRNSVFVDNTAGNPWNQAYSCGSTGRGDHVLQWQHGSRSAGADRCIAQVVARDPLLSAPADHGGPTFTMLPGASSGALGAGTDCEPVDQRGQSRGRAACDLGAVEIP